MKRIFLRKLVLRKLGPLLEAVWMLLTVAVIAWIVMTNYRMTAPGAAASRTPAIDVPYIGVAPDGGPAGIDQMRKAPPPSDSALDAAAGARCEAEDRFLVVISRGSLSLHNPESCKRSSTEAAAAMFGGSADDFLRAETKHFDAMTADPNILVAYPLSDQESVIGDMKTIDDNFAHEYSAFRKQQTATAFSDAGSRQRILANNLGEMASVIFLIFLSGTGFYLLWRLEERLGAVAAGL